MFLSLKERKAAASEVSRKQKGKILDEFVKLTDYTGCYSSYVLRNFGKKVKVNINGKNAADKCYCRGATNKEKNRQLEMMSKTFSLLIQEKDLRIEKIKNRRGFFAKLFGIR